MSAYGRQINSPVEGTADRSVGWKMTHKAFFLLSGHLCVALDACSSLYLLTTLQSPFLCPLSLSYLLSTVASISALSGDFVEHFARNIIS